MRQVLDRECPACRNGVGLARAVSTIPIRLNRVTVRMACLTCGLEWNIEQEDPLVSGVLTATTISTAIR
jgi:hypothetical protein